MTPAETPVAIGSDHAGVALKATLRGALEVAGHPVLDLGTEGEASVDYPDFAAAVAAAVAGGRARYGVLVCGTGIGIAIAANRDPAIRCAVVTDSTAPARLLSRYVARSSLSPNSQSHQLPESRTFDSAQSPA